VTVSVSIAASLDGFIAPFFRGCDALPTPKLARPPVEILSRLNVRGSWRRATRMERDAGGAGWPLSAA